MPVLGLLGIALSAALLAACAWQRDMTEGQLERALYRMTLTECHSRARAAIGGDVRDELERASLTHDCMRQYGE